MSNKLFVVSFHQTGITHTSQKLYMQQLRHVVPKALDI